VGWNAAYTQAPASRDPPVRRELFKRAVRATRAARATQLLGRRGCSADPGCSSEPGCSGGPDPLVLPGSTAQNLNPSPWDQGEGQGSGFEL